MKPLLVVGDLHGRHDLVDHALKFKETHEVIFMGDYLDSFEASDTDCLKTLSKVLSAVANCEARALWGNHEISYISSEFRASGFRPSLHEAVLKLKPLMFRSLDICLFYEPNILISHAGFHPKLWEIQNPSLMNEKLWSHFLRPESALHFVSYRRGGSEQFGGPFWLDWEEFQPYPEINQIVGHTRARNQTGILRSNITSDSLNFCVDCLDIKPVFFQFDRDCAVMQIDAY